MPDGGGDVDEMGRGSGLRRTETQGQGGRETGSPHPLDQGRAAAESSWNRASARPAAS